MADHGDQIPLPAHLDPQNAEAGLRVVEGDPLHQPGQGLRRRAATGCGRDGGRGLGQAALTTVPGTAGARVGCGMVASSLWPMAH